MTLVDKLMYMCSQHCRRNNWILAADTWILLLPYFMHTHFSKLHYRMKKATVAFDLKTHFRKWSIRSNFCSDCEPLQLLLPTRRSILQRILTNVSRCFVKNAAPIFLSAISIAWSTDQCDQIVRNFNIWENISPNFIVGRNTGLFLRPFGHFPPTFLVTLPRPNQRFWVLKFLSLPQLQSGKSFIR
jgi:hypothetical protein